MAGEEKRPLIIIKKVKKGGHGHHGGSWKVAYADFVTAMMAFFLLMWLLASLAPEQKEALAGWFDRYTIFDQGGTTFIPKQTPMTDTAGQASRELREATRGLDERAPADSGSAAGLPLESADSSKQTVVDPNAPGQLAEALRRRVEEKLGDVQDQILVEALEDGVRIQLVDRQGRPMFDLGSARPTALGQRALKFVAESFRELPNPVAVEGHTDSLGSHFGRRGNWELSTRRALSARDLLEDSGLSEHRFERVAGYADTVPLSEQDPNDARNRRIAVILWFPEVRARLR